MRNLKKVISSVAALAIVASSASAFAVTFPDVDASASYANAVEILTALNVINGDDQGLFNPENSVTRAEFTKMAVEALGEGSSATALTTSQFNDAATTSQHWAAGYIQQGVTDGFINGYDDVTFGPDDKVTYAQALKMLVASIGYTTYAENQGGYPAGYVAQATSLGITSGVSASNDTDLTRAQCAVLIYNAMKAPLCTIDGWENVSTLTGVTQQPVLKKLDGKEGRDYQNLLSDRHDAYVVKGRVTSTRLSSASSMDKDDVKYDVEVSDNFNDIINIGGSGIYASAVQADETFKVGNTNAADMLFAYTEAVVQKDDDASEFTILAITNYGNSKSVTFEADDLADTDADFVSAGTYTAGDKTVNYYKGYAKAAKLPVYKTSTSTATTKYDLDPEAKIYVNGVLASSRTSKIGEGDAATGDNLDFDKLINDYIIDNPTGTVELIDKTNVGSTSTDGDYDYVMITYYVDAVVDYVSSTASSNKIYFKQSQGASNMQWDPENDDLTLTFTKDDKQIEYTDLNEYDVLSIKYDIITNGDTLKDLDYYDIIVSSNTVTGVVTSTDPEDQTVKIDGNEYDLIDGLYTTDDVDLNTEYTLYLDAFGYVAYIDEGNSEKNYGVVVSMYMSSGNDCATVRLITSNAEVVTYECKDAAAEDAFYRLLKTGSAAGTATYDDSTVKKNATDVKANITSGKTVVEYQLSSGKIKFKNSDPTKSVLTPYGGEGLEYKASTSKLGSYSINESSTKLIDMDSYMNNDDSSVATISTFNDGAEYDAYFFDKNTNGDYRFGIVLKGTSSIRSESPIAVIQKVNGTTDVDGVTCTELLVATEGEADVQVLVDDASSNYSEGMVIAYVVSSDGYVKDTDMYVLYTPESSYTASRSTVLGKTWFSDVLGNVQKTEYSRASYKEDDTESTSKEVPATYSKTVTTPETITAAEYEALDEAAKAEYTANDEGGYSKDVTTTVTITAAEYEALDEAAKAGYEVASTTTETSTSTTTKGYVKEIKYGSNKASTTKDVFAYFGIVYKKSASTIELANFQSAAGVSAVADMESFTVDTNTNVYTYNYDEKANKGVRVSAVNSGTQNTSIFNQSFCVSLSDATVNADSKSNKNYISWTAVGNDGATPQLAFVKTVDNDVTDIVFYIND